jgi:ABC-type transport system involved in multi-copper enzyme maturation permease subunit
MSTANLSPTEKSTEWDKLAAQARRRLVWKEGKLLLPACLGLVGLAILGMIAWGLFPSNSLNDNAGAFVAFALGGGAMAALVCGSMMFSPERENKTDAFLARLPVNGSLLARTKIFTASIYFLVSYLISVGAAFGLFAVFFNGANWFWLLGTSGVLGAMLPFSFLMPAVVFLWSLAFSRYLKSTLNVVLLAACSTILVPIFATVSLSLAAEFLGFTGRYLGAILFVAMFVAKVLGLLAVIAYQHGSWLRPSVMATERTAASLAAGMVTAAEMRTRPNASWSGSMRALLWQTFRFQWLGFSVAAVAGGLYLVIALSVFFAVWISVGAEWLSFSFELANDLFSAAMGAATGVFLFAKDQTGSSFRFFQQRADYPRRIWLARVIGMLAVGAVVVLVVGIVNQVTYATVVFHGQMFRMGNEFGSFQWEASMYGNGQLSLIAPYKFSIEYFYWLTFRAATMFFVVASVGQLVSIFCRHGILNALLGIAFCSAATIWVRYINWYQVPTWAYAWPIGLAAFGLSWAYAPAWIRGTRQWTWSIVSAVVMVAVLIGCILSLRTDRLNDFPRQAYFVQLEQLFENPEKLKVDGDFRFEVARKIESAQQPIDLAWNEIRDQDNGLGISSVANRDFSDAELKLVDEFSEEFAEIVRSAKDPAVRYYFAQSPEASDKARAAKSRNLSQLLELYVAAKKDSGQKELDGLLAILCANTSEDLYVRWSYFDDLVVWAESEKRTVEEIKNAIKELQSYVDGFLSPGNLRVQEIQYLQLLSVLREYEKSDLNLFMKFDLPWEIERAKRRFENNLLVDLRQRSTSPQSKEWLNTVAAKAASFHQLERVEFDQAPTRNMVGPVSPEDVVVRWTGQYEAANHLWYVKLRLALAGWKLENGSYPERLSQLEGAFLDEEETAQRYQQVAYYPSGVDKPVVLEDKKPGKSFFPTKCEVVIAKGTPFLLPWYAAPTEQGQFQIEVKNEEGTEMVSKTDPEVGYFMGQERNWFNRWGAGNQGGERYVLKE